MIDFITYISSVVLGFYFSTFSPIHTKPTLCDQRQDISFCYYQGQSSRVVYFFHGFGNDHEAWSWNPVTERIEKDWAKNKISKPHVVSISFGRLWWYDQKKRQKINEFVAWIEKDKNLGGFERVLYGDSMGGHNSYRWAHDDPTLFKKMALICPAVPYSFVKELKTPGGLWPFYLVADSAITNNKLPNPFADDLYWKNFEKISDIHVAVSKEDHFGFYDGGKALTEALKKNASSKVSMEEQDVWHCNMMAQELGSFLGQ